MNKMMVILVIVTLQACANKPAIEPAFQPFVDDFESFTGHKVVTDILFTDDLALNQMGLCNPTERKISVSAAFWKEATVFEKEETIFHELGHCEFSMQHDNTLKKDGKPVSYMSAMMPDSREVQAHHAEYRAEFLTKVKARQR